MRAFVLGFVLIAIAFRLAGCGGDDDQVVLEVDAGELDAPPVPVCGITDVQRSEECKLLCNPSLTPLPYVCAGANTSDCYDECRAFAWGFAYCPPR